MEIFVFPELMYSLVLANIMSPRIWRWREEPRFEGIEKMKPYKRMQRLRQYIMEKYGKKEAEILALYGQEANHKTLAFGKMNMYIHNIRNGNLATGDTLLYPKFKEKEEVVEVSEPQIEEEVKEEEKIEEVKEEVKEEIVEANIST
jgi:hypothetical protein